MNKDSNRLRDFATKVVGRVGKPNDSVAITGSVARGYARADTELELWIIGARSGRSVKRIDGVNVTLIHQTLAEASQLDNLSSHDVDDLVVLEDGSGAFAKITEAWRKVKRRVRAETIRSTQVQVQSELDRAKHGSAIHRAAHLRFVCWRLMCLRLFIDRGWRTPRLHELREELPAPLRRQLDSALALPSAAICKRAVKLLPAAAREVKKLDALPDFAKLLPDEAAFLARRELMFELLPRVFREYGITDLRGAELLQSVAPKTREAFLLLEPNATEATVKKLRALAESFERSFAVS